MTLQNKPIHFFLVIFLITSLSYSLNPDIQSMKADTWKAVPNSRLAVNAACASVGEFSYLSGGNANNCEGTIAYWNGGTFDTKRNRLLIFGGGHAGWAGNEIYGFNLDDFSWERISEPSVPTACVNEYSDGTPTSRHTYNQLAYIPSTDQLFVSPGGARWCSAGQAARGTWSYDFSTSTWHRMDPAGSYVRVQMSAAVYDPASNRVFVASGHSSSTARGIWAYEVDNNQWTLIDGNFNVWSEKAAAIDTKRGLLVVLSKEGCSVYDIKNSNPVPSSKSLGIATAMAGGQGAIHYDPVADRIVGWADDYVYTLNTETWEWKQMNAKCPVPGTGTGTYGRFQYSPEENAYVLVTSAFQYTFIYKLTEGAGIREQVLTAGYYNSKTALTASPNPFSASTVISITGPGLKGNTELKIYDVTGKTVKSFSQMGQSFCWNPQDMTAGIYFARLTTGKSAYTQRLFLIK